LGELARVAMSRLSLFVVLRVLGCLSAVCMLNGVRIVAARVIIMQKVVARGEILKQIL
jgi:hypothetical protein